MYLIHNHSEMNKEEHMDTIIDKLSEIEDAAVGILEHADVEKKEYEDIIKVKQHEFDASLAEQTASTINAIKSKAKRKLDAQLEEMRAKNEIALQAFQDEYDNNHTSYATQIFKRITEV